MRTGLKIGCCNVKTKLEWNGNGLLEAWRTKLLVGGETDRELAAKNTVFEQIFQCKEMNL